MPMPAKVASVFTADNLLRIQQMAAEGSSTVEIAEAKKELKKEEKKELKKEEKKSDTDLDRSDVKPPSPFSS
jgi:hypothetical protein